MSNRIQVIDVLRGVIMYGVMVVNTATINGPYYLNAIDFAFVFNMYDYVIAEVISFLFLQKSYPIFVFLFGLGNQLFLQSLIKKYKGNLSVFNIFIKRMFVLGVIGFLHGALFYWGDILLMYSVLGSIVGFMIIFIFRADYKKILYFNIFLIVLSLIINVCSSHLINNDQLILH